MIKRASVLVSAGAFAAIALCAQGLEPPPVIQIAREFIKQGKGASHRKAEQAYVTAFRKANFPYHYLALSAESGSPEVMFLEAYPSFAAIEQSDNLSQKEPLKSEIEAADADDGEQRSNSRNVAAIYHPELSYIPANPIAVGKTRYMMISTYRVRIGHNDDFLAGSKMVLDGYRRAMLETTVLTYEVIAGAPDGTYIFLEPMASLKSMDEEPARQLALSTAIGSDRLKNLMKGAGDVFVSMENALYAISPEMSYVSKTTEDEDPAFWRPAPPASTSAKPARPKKKIEKAQKTTP